MLRKFMTDRGKIKPRRVTGNCAQHQHQLSMAIKRGSRDGARCPTPCRSSAVASVRVEASHLVTGRATHPLQVALLAGAAALGVATLGSSPWAMANMQWALIGLPIAAAAAAALAYGGHSVIAAVALAVGVVIAGLAHTWSALFAVPAVLAVLAAIVLLRRFSYVAVGAGLIGVFTVAGYAFDTVLAAAQKRTLEQEIVAQGKILAAQAATVADPKTSGELAKQIIEVYKQAVVILPSLYFVLGTFLAVLVIAAIAWVAHRVDEPVAVPAFDRVDLPPLIVVGAVVGLLAAGIARAASAGPLWTAIAANFILCTGYLLLIQGLAVYSALLKRAQVGTPGRVAAYVVLLVLDLLLHIVALTGLADMWLNFRRLPREGRPDLPLKPAPSSGDDVSSGV